MLIIESDHPSEGCGPQNTLLVISILPISLMAPLIPSVDCEATKHNHLKAQRVPDKT